jgi:hypothetical protein
MIGVAIALILLGLVLAPFVWIVGVPVFVVGLVLIGLFFAGFGRRAAEGETPAEHRF